MIYKNKVSISDRQKDIKLPTGLRLLIRKCCTAVLEYEKFNHDTEISVSFISDNEIMLLNEQYRDKPTKTDVLSFPLGENGNYDKNPNSGAILLGDIVISAQRAFEQARTYEHTIEREFAFLTVHSMFHLLGYDHELGGLHATQMREKEEAVLEQIGISRVISLVNSNEL